MYAGPSTLNAVGALLSSVVWDSNENAGGALLSSAVFKIWFVCRIASRHALQRVVWGQPGWFQVVEIWMVGDLSDMNGSTPFRMFEKYRVCRGAETKTCLISAGS